MRTAMRHLGVLLLTVLPSVALAQPSVADLRSRTDAAEAAHPEVPHGSYEGVRYVIDVAERIERTFAEQSLEWRARGGRYVTELEAGRDPYVSLARGAITNRGYMSPISSVRQGYGIYLPENYDPSRSYPLLIMMHGGSSNGNLFLGVVLGNNMDWLTYDEHLWDEYTPRWSPNWIVVAPDGFGQVLWRWMGEADVLRVIDDVQAHYNVDADRVVLGGLSNGGLGAYAIGTRHAWRFSMVQAIAGAPSWLQYTGGSPTPEERIAMMTHSGMHLAENTLDTTFRFYHGSRDTGPMRPAYVTEMEASMRERNIPANVQWFDHGHDLLYLVHRHGRVYDAMAPIVRERHPSELRLTTGDYRASRQHWLEMTRIDEYPRLSHNRAIASSGAINITTERALELAVYMNDAPIGDGENVSVQIDGATAYEGRRAPLGHVAHFRREGGRIDGAWGLGFLPVADGLEKIPGLSGPLTDPYRDGMIHVYGTQDPEATAALRSAAERGARGWPLWLWNHSQRVVADTDVTEEMMRSSNLVLYATPGSNSVLDRMDDALPIHVTAEGVRVGETLHDDRGIGVRFVYPNPLISNARGGRYIIVQAAPTTDAVSRGNNLPDFLADWVVYGASATRSRSRLILGRGADASMGYFDRFWHLAPSVTASLAPEGSYREVLADLEGADDGPVPVLDVYLAQDDGAGAEAPPVETPEERARRLALNRLLGMPDDFFMSPSVLAQTPTPELPVPEAPAVPPPPTHFAAPRSDPAGRAARTIARRIPTLPNYRAIIPGGVWGDDARVWSIRSDADCLAALDASGIPYVRPPETFRTPIPTPVEITGPIDGVTYEMVVRPHRETLRVQQVVVVSCEMALRMRTISRVAAAHDVNRITLLSAYRTAPRSSFHTMGLGLDLFEFHQADGTVLSVLDDFVETPADQTCDAPRGRGAARTLLNIACELARSHDFSSVLTPNYNDGHRNHFHLDSRPDDPRTFVR